MDITRENEVQDLQGVRIEQQKKQDKEYRLIGKVKRIAGLTLFSYNTVTKELKKAEMQRNVSIGFDGKPVFTNKATKEKDCIYFQALNVKSAKKRLIKLGYEVQS